MITKTNATIRITNLTLQAIIGCNEWERLKKQEIVINISMEFDYRAAAQSDNLTTTLDYRGIKKRIISEIDNSSFMLLEKLTDHVLNIVMSYEKVISATVRIDKPHALRFADSVSIEVSAQRKE
jgi:D-erythro-7,8-dihydroneopterin triphosphate epimerase